MKSYSSSHPHQVILIMSSSSSHISSIHPHQAYSSNDPHQDIQIKSSSSIDPHQVILNKSSASSILIKLYHQVIIIKPSSSSHSYQIISWSHPYQVISNKWSSSSFLIKLSLQLSIIKWSSSSHSYQIISSSQPHQVTLNKSTSSSHPHQVILIKLKPGLWIIIRSKMTCSHYESFSIWILNCYFKKDILHYCFLLLNTPIFWQELFSAVGNDFW